jgi:uncharacterized protein (TIGR02266 family)
MDRRPSFSERPTVPSPPRSDVLAGAEATAGERDRTPYLRDAARESGRAPVGERRGLFRVRTELDISLGADGHFFTARSVNLSPGGLLVSTYRAIARGATLSIEFELPASRVMAQGEVVWSREASLGSIPGYGVAFTEMSRFDRTLIESYCAHLAPEAYPQQAPVRRLAG